MSESSSFRIKRREVGGEIKKVLTDEPFGIFGVRKRRWATLGEDGAQELLVGLGISRRLHHDNRVGCCIDD